MEKAKVSRWRRWKSSLGKKERSERLQIQKCEKTESDGVRTEGSPRSTGARNISNLPPSLKSSRRPAICDVIEEEDQRHGISLAESRRRLMIVYFLTKSGLL